MKTLVILYAGNAGEFACSPLFDGKSASDLSFDWAVSVPDVSCVAIFDSDSTPEVITKKKLPAENIELKHIYEKNWTCSLLLKHMAEISEGYDAVVYGFVDRPFYNVELTEKLLSVHKDCGAEYTFADGYPEGLTPEILDSGTIRIIKNLAEDNTGIVTYDSIFSVMKKDINAFEIETEIAPKDMRSLRLNLSCCTKRDTLLCTRIFEKQKKSSVKDVCTVIEENPEILRTLPAFYAIQIAVDCSGGCTFCPYPAAAKVKYGKNPGACNLFMKLDDFKKIVKKIYDFSNDAVISLSLWGEALRHPFLNDFVMEVLSYQSLSLLIETTGDGFQYEKAKELSELVKKLPERTNGQNAINWIVGLDAVNKEKYEELHSCDLFDHANKTVDDLLGLFPGCVYPQFIRLKENEDQLETFYRSWKEKCGNVIIQKYDNFCGKLPDKKVADLAPVNRNVCWHLKRDMSILVDGSVPWCKEALLDDTCGNAFKDKFENIWEKNNDRFAEQLKRQYNGICGNCDEYYTFNF